jgi:hypothetical protein
MAAGANMESAQENKVNNSQKYKIFEDKSKLHRYNYSKHFTTIHVV